MKNKLNYPPEAPTKRPILNFGVVFRANIGIHQTEYNLI